MNIYARNVKTYPYFKFFFNLLIIGPILVPYMLFKGLNYAEIMLLQSISAISVILFEVPTGAIADKVSRSLSLVFSGFFAAAGLLLYILFSSFWVFAIAEIIFGIGMTFSSGADAAILYESLVKLERKKDYQKVEANAAFYVFMGHAFGSIVSSFIYTFNHFLPFWISIANIFIAICISFNFKDVDHKKSEHHYVLHVVKSIGVAVKTPRILWTILFATLMGFAFRTSFWLYQPYFNQVGIEVKWFGLIFFYFNIIAALSSKFLIKRFYDTRPRRVLISLALILAFTYIIPAIFVFPWIIALLGLQQVVRGLYSPTLRFYINHQIGNKYRATVISLVSLAASLGFAILSPFIGINLDEFGTIPTYFLMGIITIGGAFLLILLRNYQKYKKKKIKYLRNKEK